MGQIAVAGFANPSGLIKTGKNLYIQSNNSGRPEIGAAGTGGRGTIAPSSLEMSNVDLAEEFTQMIITQRGFQANSGYHRVRRIASGIGESKEIVTR